MHVTRTVLILAALLLGTQACAPKEEPESAENSNARQMAPENKTADKAKKVKTGEGRGTIFVDDAFLSFEIPDCKLDDADALRVNGNGEGENGTTFDISIEDTRVSVVFSDGRTISGSAPDTLQVRNQSLSGQFELDGSTEATGLLFAECSE